MSDLAVWRVMAVAALLWLPAPGCTQQQRDVAALAEAHPFDPPTFSSGDPLATLPDPLPDLLGGIERARGQPKAAPRRRGFSPHHSSHWFDEQARNAIRGDPGGIERLLEGGSRDAGIWHHCNAWSDIVREGFGEDVKVLGRLAPDPALFWRPVHSRRYRWMDRFASFDWLGRTVVLFAEQCPRNTDAYILLDRFLMEGLVATGLVSVSSSLAERQSHQPSSYSSAAKRSHDVPSATPPSLQAHLPSGHRVPTEDEWRVMFRGIALLAGGYPKSVLGLLRLLELAQVLLHGQRSRELGRRLIEWVVERSDSDSLCEARFLALRLKHDLALREGRREDAERFARQAFVECAGGVSVGAYSRSGLEEGSPWARLLDEGLAPEGQVLLEMPDWKAGAVYKYRCAKCNTVDLVEGASLCPADKRKNLQCILPGPSYLFVVDRKETYPLALFVNQQEMRRKDGDRLLFVGRPDLVCPTGNVSKIVPLFPVRQGVQVIRCTGGGYRRQEARVLDGGEIEIELDFGPFEKVKERWRPGALWWHQLEAWDWSDKVEFNRFLVPNESIAGPEPCVLLHKQLDVKFEELSLFGGRDVAEVFHLLRNAYFALGRWIPVLYESRGEAALEQQYRRLVRALLRFEFDSYRLPPEAPPEAVSVAREALARVADDDDDLLQLLSALSGDCDGDEGAHEEGANIGSGVAGHPRYQSFGKRWSWSPDNRGEDDDFFQIRAERSGAQVLLHAWNEKGLWSFLPDGRTTDVLPGLTVRRELNRAGRKPLVRLDLDSGRGMILGAEWAVGLGRDGQIRSWRHVEPRQYATGERQEMLGLRWAGLRKSIQERAFWGQGALPIACAGKRHVVIPELYVVESYGRGGVMVRDGDGGLRLLNGRGAAVTFLSMGYVSVATAVDETRVATLESGAHSSVSLVDGCSLTEIWRRDVTPPPGRRWREVHHWSCDNSYSSCWQKGDHRFLAIGRTQSGLRLVAASGRMVVLDMDGRVLYSQADVWPVAVGDLDGDGEDEVLVRLGPGKDVLSDWSTPLAVMDLEGRELWRANGPVGTVQVMEDLDGDGRKEIAVGGVGSTPMVVVYGFPPGRPAERGSERE